MNIKISFTTFQLKVIALILMSIDHVGAFFTDTPQWFRYLGRMSAPVFVFCLAWGMYYTKNRKKYILRLYCAAIGMEIVWWIIYQFTILEIPSEGYNVFVTLMNSAILIELLFSTSNKRRDKKKICLVIIVWQVISTSLCFLITLFPYSLVSRRMVVALTGNIFLCEGGLFFVLLGVAIYAWKDNKKRLAIGYTLFCIYDMVISATAIYARITYFVDFYTLGHGKLMEVFCYLITGREYWQIPMVLHDFYWGDYQWMMIGALPLFLLYNGNPGKKVKWLFYVFYPMHLVVLLLVKNFLV